MHLIHRKTCRVCGSAALTPAMSLGEQYLQGLFVKPGKGMPPRRKIPLSVVLCDPARDERACGLLQLEHSTPATILYGAYWYRSGTNQTMRDHLRAITDEVIETLGRREARVLDIGCNDGTLLRCYPPNVIKFGVDPSDVALGVTGENLRVVNDLFPSKALWLASGGTPFDVVTSIAMFYDLEDPVGFAREVRKALAPDGLWVFEMSYMPTMLERNSYDTICHEHLEYYSVAAVEDILGRADMKLLRVGFNDINGGSVRCYATPAENMRAPIDGDRLDEVRRREFDGEFDTVRPYREFQQRVERHREELSALLRRLRSEGKRIHVYGASTKGNTILQWCGLDASVIDCAADRNPEKDGARTLGTDIPIVSEEKSRAMNPDYYLVLPWHFRSEFIEREKAMIARGTAMIFPLPSIEIVKRG